MEDQIQRIQWDFLKTSILRQRCILFLGPGVSMDMKNPSNRSDFYTSLADLHKNDILSYHVNDGFLIFKNSNTQLLNTEKIKSFFAQDFSNPVLEKVSEIPFHFIVNVCPDLTMPQIFRKKGFSFNQSYYNLHRLVDIDHFPTKHRPLIYNLFGSINNDESIILSHHNLFNYLKSIYSYNNLPQTVKTLLSRDYADSIIFLGFEFDKWYYQLVIKLLNLDFEPCIRYAAQQSQLKREIQTLYESHFLIDFVANNEDFFISKLHQHFLPEELRMTKTSDNERVYLRTNIIRFLNIAFNAQDLDSLCWIFFEDVYNHFTSEQSKLTRLNLLLDHVTRHERLDELLQHGKEHNSVQYEKFGPYYEN